MTITVTPDPVALGRQAGAEAAAVIKNAIDRNGLANIILATGTSQFETLNTLIADEAIDWGKVVMFHLDEYIGLPVTSMASFRRYLQERFLDLVPPLQAVYLINGEGDAAAECERLNAVIRRHPIDLCLAGIGENGHLAFNDPPADFDTELPYIIVHLDEACRRQQYGEGWFASFDDVPKQAISMSVQQILKSKHIICSVPDSRKAPASQRCFENEVSNLYPASILQTHPHCSFFLDESAAELLKTSTLEKFVAQ